MSHEVKDNWRAIDATNCEIAGHLVGAMCAIHTLLEAADRLLSHNDTGLFTQHIKGLVRCGKDVAETCRNISATIQSVDADDIPF